MRTLNLNRDFIPLPYAPIEFESFRFNGGESHIKITGIIKEDKNVTITHRIKSGDDVMLILLANDALRNLGFTCINLFIPYIPYGRQDRLCDIGEAFSLKVFASLLNSCNFSQVSAVDPHSDISGALINNFVPWNINQQLVRILNFLAKDAPVTLISPDAGAYKKINKFHSRFGGESDLVVCTKKRNPVNGQLSDIKVHADTLEGQNCLIIDDICDGGRTFIGIAQELLKLRPKGLYLYVTHGIFSNGFKELESYFDRIYTTDSVVPQGLNPTKLTTLHCI